MGFQQNLFALEDKKDFQRYSQSFQSPFYEPTGDEPDINEIYDIRKYNLLLEDIDKVDCSEDVKRFLCLSATRFIIFRFDKIAEFYAHQGKDIQDIMKRLALVIVDFDSAIRNGFVKLDKNYQDMLGNILAEKEGKNENK